MSDQTFQRLDRGIKWLEQALANAKQARELVVRDSPNTAADFAAVAKSTVDFAREELTIAWASAKFDVTSSTQDKAYLDRLIREATE